MTDQNPPPGWYPDNTGRSRWWDGVGWTDRYEDAEPSPVPAYAPPVMQAAANKKSRSWLVPAVVGVVALLVGVGIGAAGNSADEPDKPAAAKSSSGETAADLDEREESLDNVENLQADFSTELKRREKKVESAEKAAKANTIDGDGTYEVGVDIEAGKWKNADRGENCYWSINSDGNGENIVTNGNGGGPQTLDIAKGQFLEIANDCGVWKKIG